MILYIYMFLDVEVDILSYMNIPTCKTGYDIMQKIYKIYWDINWSGNDLSRMEVSMEWKYKS